ncbi:MAG: hypothetical protein NVSMB43_17180 [Pseudarthrobacter sp.]
MLTPDTLPQDKGVLAADSHDEGNAGAEAQGCGGQQSCEVHIFQANARPTITPPKDFYFY